jgi:hypothetical protein
VIRYNFGFWREGVWLAFFRFGFGFLLAPAIRSCAGVRDLLLRWHPRLVLPASSVAPVRGGTYFSLPPQRKVGKRKRLTPPALVFA